MNAHLNHSKYLHIVLTSFYFLHFQMTPIQATTNRV